MDILVIDNEVFVYQKVLLDTPLPLDCDNTEAYENSRKKIDEFINKNGHGYGVNYIVKNKITINYK